MSLLLTFGKSIHASYIGYIDLKTLTLKITIHFSSSFAFERGFKLFMTP